MITIEHIYISPGRYYFGHDGGPAGKAPIMEADEVQCIAGRGIMVARPGRFALPDFEFGKTWGRRMATECDGQ